ncbi:MAG: acyl-CoA dehydratase activase [bacterium]
MYIGIDIGSVSVKAAVVGEGREILFVNEYTRHEGQPIRTLKAVLGDVLSRYPRDRIKGMAVTGSGRALASELLKIEAVNDIKAPTAAMNALHPEVRTLIEIGGKDAKLTLFEYNPSSRTLLVRDSARNTLCAAGTGSFLDQQAARLGYSIEEFGEIALRSQNPSNISGRCSVFAKTDLIHLQQIATPDYDMLAGLCYAVVRNFLSSIAKGRKLVPPIAFIGGVAANVGVIRAFERSLKIPDGALIVPENFTHIPAIGAAIIARESDRGGFEFPSLEAMEDYLNGRDRGGKRMSPLSLLLSKLPDYKPHSYSFDSSKKIPVFLGVDVGSISTNVVAIDEGKNLVARRYLWTSGRPIEAVRQGIKEIGEEIGPFVEVAGVGVTGSGRYLIGDFIGADVVRNEITAQAMASIHIDPTVDTIFEIGGQDSKFIALENGVVTDFSMNKVCAAGTGSFLEEQAEKMDINIEDEFSRLALQSQAPVDCGERCTVFMEQDLVQYLQAGVSREDLTAGLSYSIAKNYLNKVAIRHKIGKNIFFQGAVAFNKGVVAAFERLLGQPITVPPNHDVTGAIGVAMLALAARPERSKFRGFEAVVQKQYKLRSFTCKGCENFCDIKRVDIEGEEPLFYGDRCDERYGNKKNKRRIVEDIPDLFGRREELLLRNYVPPAPDDAPSVGIPRALIFHEYFPLWNAFFSKLGFRVVPSDPTNKTLANKGVEYTTTETCFPIKVLYGHILNLLEKGVEYIFLPTMVDQRQTDPKYEGKIKYNCPYVQASGYMVRSGIDFEGNGTRVLQPTLFYGFSERVTVGELVKMGRAMGRSAKQVKEALKIAEDVQRQFREACLEEGRKAMESLREDRTGINICRTMNFVIVSRPYNGCDPGMNLNLARTLRELGALPIPMDFLPLEEVDILSEYENMYWNYGQKILSAGKIIAGDERLNAIYITNFRCGPDAFIIPFFQKVMGEKPFLQLEFDDHDADAGVITRCEAFIDSLHNAKRNGRPEAPTPRVRFSHKERRTIYIPHMGDHAYAMKAAFEAYGHSAEVMVSDDETLRIGREHSSGKECLPYVITTGDMVKVTRRPDFDPDRSAFFIAATSGPCRFGLYNEVQRMVLNELGLKNVPIIAPNQAGDFFGQIGVPRVDFFRLVWRGCLAYEFLGKMLREVRPYEVNPGETDRVYERCKEDLYRSLVRRENPVASIGRARKAFEAIEVDKREPKPKIGIIGEVFVRMHEYSNGYTVRKIEKLGGEAWLPPLQEWMYHVNRSVKLYSRAKGRYNLMAKIWLQDKIQKWDEKQIAGATNGLISTAEEPAVEEIWRNAERYFLAWFGEASLGVGKSVDYARRGASGIVNLMPFTCLIGAICKTQLQKFREDHDHIPILHLEYDGLDESALWNDLESFMDQAKDYNARNHRW